MQILRGPGGLDSQANQARLGWCCESSCHLPAAQTRGLNACPEENTREPGCRCRSPDAEGQAASDPPWQLRSLRVCKGHVQLELARSGAREREEKGEKQA